MKRMQKISASLLLSTMFLGSIAPVIPVSSPLVAYAMEQDSSDAPLSNVTKKEQKHFSDSDPVTVIVKLKEETVSPESIQTEEGRQEREEATKKPRKEALQAISDAGISYDKIFEYNLLFNGFALKTTYGEAQEIQQLAFVDSVELTVDYSAPTTSSTPSLQAAAQGQAIESNQLINVQPLWDKGIKGQGQVVAIIDSGLDPEHDILHISDLSTAKYQNKEQMDVARANAGISYGKWYSDKLVYAFNYSDWNNDIKEDDTSSHGMHVTGSAVGNPTQPSPTGDYVAGVAPEAQVMFMRVFSDKKGGGSTSSFLYIKAIEDAVKLGADVINMSLGGAAGSVSQVGDAVTGAIQLAKDSGVTVAIAAGNSAVFGSGYANPSTLNPDYGLVGDPSVAYDAISVAAVNNSVLNFETVTVPELADNTELNNGIGLITTYQTLFDPEESYQYIYAGLGREEDFADTDATGKIALIQRGSITFTEKVKQAKAAGAIGVIIFNHETGGEERLSMSLDNEDADFPVVSMGHSFGQELSEHADDYTLSFTGKNIKQLSEHAGTMAEFTSWGMSADGELKPDVTAPGGDIYSSFNDNTYGTISGTSMASPHTAGAIALVKQVIAQRFAGLSGSEIQALIKHLIMSTASPNFNTSAGAYTSPRQQGAGVIDVAKAAISDLYLTGTNDYGSLSLGNVADTFTLTIQVHNIGNTDKELSYVTYLNTDDASNGAITLQPRQLQVTKGTETVTVPAGSTQTISIAVDASAFTEELQKQFANGYWLEGFVRFTDTSTGEEVVGIPYVGFHGVFQNLSVFEPAIYDFTGDNKPFYYYTSDDHQVKDPGNNFTSLMTVSLDSDGNITVPTLGEFEDDVTGTYTYDGSKLAISPNGDNIQDLVAFKAVVLRNYENLSLSIYRAEDTELTTPLYQDGNGSGRKTYYDNGNGEKSSLIDEGLWNGSADDGSKLPDGQYQYVLRYQPQATGSDVQEMRFNLTIDTIAPALSIENSDYDSDSRLFTPDIVEEGSGLYLATLSYTTETDEGELDTIIPENEDGSYTIPDTVSLEQVTYTLTDYAGNTSTTALNDFDTSQEDTDADPDTDTEPETENGAEAESDTEKMETGQLSIQLQQGDSILTQYASVAVFKVTNEKGEVVGEEYTKDNKILRDLPYGTYTVEVALLHEDLTLTSEKTQTVTLSADQPQQTVTFQVVETQYNRLTVTFDKAVPDGSKVYVVAPSGQEIPLAQSKYNALSFEKMVANGEYTLKIVLPDGYSVAENGSTVTVGNHLNRLALTLQTPVYITDIATSADSTISATVHLDEDSVLSDTVFTVEQTEGSTLPELTDKLSSVSNGQKVDFYTVSLSRNESPVAVTGKRHISLPATGNETSVYLQKTDGSIAALTSTLEDGRLIVETDDFGVLAVVSSLDTQAPETPADTTNKAALEAELAQIESVLASPDYQTSSAESKQHYQTTAAIAQSVFNKSDATQEEIDAALANLQASRAALSKHETTPNGDTDASSTQSSHETTPTATHTKTYTDTKTGVRVTLTGVDAQMELTLSVQKLDKNSLSHQPANTTDYQAYDITFRTADGSIYTVLGRATVSLPIPDGKQVDKALYLLDNGSDILTEELPFTLENGSAIFQVEHFSIYALAFEQEEQAEASDSLTGTPTTVTPKGKTVLPQTGDVTLISWTFAGLPLLLLAFVLLLGKSSSNKD